MNPEHRPAVAPDREPGDLTEEEVDQELADSFPASDPPSFSSPLRAGEPARAEEDDEQDEEEADDEDAPDEKDSDVIIEDPRRS